MKEHNFKNNEEYHNLPALSQSGIKDFKECPYKFWKNTPLNINKEPKPSTDAMMFGTLCHLLVLEPELFANEFLVADWGAKGRKTKKYDNFVAELRENGDERKVISQEEYEKAMEMKHCLMQNKFCWDLINKSAKEKPIVGEEFGLIMKGKPDCLLKTVDENGKPYYIYVDYKTTGESFDEPNPFYKGWLTQACSYSRLLKQKYGIEINECIFVVQSTSEPNKILPFTISHQEIEDYTEEFISDILILKEHIEQARTLIAEEKDPDTVFVKGITEPILITSGGKKNSYWAKLKMFREQYKEDYATETELREAFDKEFREAVLLY